MYVCVCVCNAIVYCLPLDLSGDKDRSEGDFISLKIILRIIDRNLSEGMQPFFTTCIGDIWRRSWRDGYRLPVFKSWTRIFPFLIERMCLIKVRIQLSTPFLLLVTCDSLHWLTWDQLQAVIVHLINCQRFLVIIAKWILSTTLDC